MTEIPKTITLPHPANETATLRAVIDETETTLQLVVETTLLRQPTRPPATSPAATGGQPAGIGWALQKYHASRQSLQARLDGLQQHDPELARITTSAAAIDRTALRKIYDEVNVLKAILRGHENGAVAAPTEDRLLRELGLTLYIVIGIIERAAAEQERLASPGVDRLTRQAAEISRAIGGRTSQPADAEGGWQTSVEPSDGWQTSVEPSDGWQTSIELNADDDEDPLGDLLGRLVDPERPKR